MAMGLVFVRGPLLGRNLLRGSVFRPFSCRALLVTLTPESCREKRRIWAVISLLLILPKPRKVLPWEPHVGQLVGKSANAKFCVSDSSQVEVGLAKLNF